jgi:hypothetical protein
MEGHVAQELLTVWAMLPLTVKLLNEVHVAEELLLEYLNDDYGPCCP